jgi:two-component system cell cycle sensor histidine kinase/response regulator CckA
MEPVLDREAALARVDGDISFLRELVAVFLQDAALRLSAIRDAIAQGDDVELARAAHSLKGAAASIGAIALSSAALHLERVASDGDVAQMSLASAALEVAFDELRPVLGEILVAGNHTSGDSRLSPSRSAVASNGNACVLVIDDDPTVRLATRQALRVAGFDVLTAATGDEGVHVARDARPDIILLDVVLPGESGLEICQRLKGDPTLAAIPVLMASAQRTSSDSRADGLDAGADGYIVRPVANHELVAWVRAMLRVKTAEEANRYLRAIVDSSHDAIIGVALNGTLSSWNEGAARIYGYTATESIGQPLGILVDTERSEELEQLLSRARAGEHVDDFETVQRRRDGTAIDVSLTISPIWDASRRIIGTSVIARDISERKRAEAEQARLKEQLRQAQKLEAIGRLAGGVAHDFNNRLTVMKGYTQFLLKRLPAADPRRADAERVEATIDTCGRLMRQLLVFSRREPLDASAVDLNELVGEMVPTVRALLGERVRLRVRASPALPRIHADRDQLEQVLMNLVTNARDAIAPAGGVAVGDTLTMETASVDAGAFAQHVVNGPVEPGAYVMLAVSDNGRGMSPEVRERIFEPFFTTKEVGQGTGLGLASVFGVIAQHRGYIACDTAPGRGTVFRLYFPCEAGAAPDLVPGASAPRPQLRQAAARPTVLVVEDEDNLRELLVQSLEDAGYRIGAAAGADDALKLVALLDARVDVLVTDVIMPGDSGPTLARRLMQQYPGLGVILISGYTPATLDLSELPGARFLQKPFGVEELVQAVGEMVSG